MTKISHIFILNLSILFVIASSKQKHEKTPFALSVHIARSHKNISKISLSDFILLCYSRSSFEYSYSRITKGVGCELRVGIERERERENERL